MLILTINPSHLSPNTNIRTPHSTTNTGPKPPQNYKQHNTVLSTEYENTQNLLCSVSQADYSGTIERTCVNSTEVVTTAYTVP